MLEKQRATVKDQTGHCGLVSGEWPVCYQTQLTIGSLESNVGICTLWTDQSVIARDLSRESYAACGNLYSVWGISYLVRNVLANPKIRYIVLCGADQSDSGQALVNFFLRGVDENHSIVGAAGRVHKEIPLQAISLLRESVEFIDLRGVAQAKYLTQKIARLKRLPPFGSPQVFPESTPSTTVMPSEHVGFKVVGNTVAETWLKVLHLVMQFGEVKPSEYTLDQKELLNVMAVISAEDPDKSFLPLWLPFDHNDLEAYYPQVLSADIVPASVQGRQLAFWHEGLQGKANELVTLKYTYGGRFRNYRGVGHDQVESLIQLLSTCAYTRRAVAVTWDPLVDVESEHPPCLMSLLFSIQAGKLYSTAHFRSHDIYGAWCHNAFALRKLQHEVAKRLGVALGALTMLSHSAHVYSDKWESTEELLKANYPRLPKWTDDPRGNFHICVQNGSIVLEHATTIEGTTGVSFEGTTARELYLSVANSNLVSLPEHMAYLGYELCRAELCLRLGCQYRQDGEDPERFAERLRLVSAGSHQPGNEAVRSVQE